MAGNPSAGRFAGRWARLLAAALLFAAAAEGFYRIATIIGPLENGTKVWTRNAFRVYALGGSIAVAYPNTDLVSFSSILGRMYGGRVGGRTIVTRIVSSPGDTITSDAYYLHQLLVLGGPGAVLVYSGINRPRPASHERLAALFERLRDGPLGRSWLLQGLMFRLAAAYRIRGEPEAAYESALRRIVRETKAAGLQPILATVVLEQDGREPRLMSLRSPDDALKRDIERVLTLERRRRWAEAGRAYLSLIERYPFARNDLLYRSCGTLAASGAAAEARRCYERASPDFALAAEHERVMERVARETGTPLIRTQERFERRAPRGIAGNELFDDEVHPNIAGQIVLAEAFADELSRAFHEEPSRRFASAEELLADLQYQQERRACGRLGAGFLAMHDAERLPHASQRTALARADFQEALAAAPGNGTALLGLGLAEAAARDGDTFPETKFYRLDTVDERDQHRGYQCLRACFTTADRGEAVRAMLQAGIDRASADKIADAVRGCR